MSYFFIFDKTENFIWAISLTLAFRFFQSNFIFHEFSFFLFNWCVFIIGNIGIHTDIFIQVYTVLWPPSYTSPLFSSFLSFIRVRNLLFFWYLSSCTCFGYLISVKIYLRTLLRIFSEISGIKDPIGFNPIQRTTGNEKGWEQKSPSPGKNTTIYYPISNGQPWTYTQVTLYRLRRLYLWIYVYTYMNIAIINVKEVMNLKEIKEVVR